MYGDTPISFSRNTTTKAMKLLQVLLYYGEKGISRNKLIENLYKTEELADAPNSLRVTSYRLKKMLVNMGLPEHNYIRISKGIYYWNGPMETEVDVHLFVSLLQEAEKEIDVDKQMELLRQACYIYKGELLPGSSEEEWVLIESVQCKNCTAVLCKSYVSIYGTRKNTKKYFGFVNLLVLCIRLMSGRRLKLIVIWQ